MSAPSAPSRPPAQMGAPAERIDWMYEQDAVQLTSKEEDDLMNQDPQEAEKLALRDKTA